MYGVIKILLARLLFHVICNDYPWIAPKLENVTILQQFGKQDGSFCRSHLFVVREEHILDAVIKCCVLADSSDNCSHAIVYFSINPWLWPCRIIVHDDVVFWSAWQTHYSHIL